MTVSSAAPDSAWRTHEVWLAPIGIAAAALALIAILAPAPKQTAYVELLGRPKTGDVYFIGNSMFGTGLDIEAVRKALPNERATLAYYDGNYTSMWYAAFRNSLIPSGIRPKVVIWGFRPTYAVRPAFRQNKETALDQLHDPDDPVFSAVLANAEGRQSNSDESHSNSAGWSRTFMETLTDAAPIVKRRSDLRFAISNGLARNVARVFAPANATATSFANPDSGIKISDVIISFATGGEVRKADALVIDNGEQFVYGNEVPFEDSFIPLTIQLLQKADIPQLVIIFKPRSVLGSGMPEAADAYYKDAIAYLEGNGIPYLDFVADSDLTANLYAKGDHYTQAGMTYVTSRIVDTLRKYAFVE